MLEVRNLTKRFGGLAAVDDASLDVPEGSITGLIGPNGAGKTTLFATVAGFHKPDAGSIRFLGREIAGQPAHRVARLGMARTFQIVQPFAGLSVRQNIAVGCHRHTASHVAALREAGAVAARVGMAELVDRPAGTLTVSGRKRLELARALATRPRLLLLDEVMAGLIPSEVAAILPVIRAIRDAGVTILMIEHVMQAVMSLSDSVHVLAQGRVIASGAPAELVRNPTVVEAYLGHGAAARLQADA